MVFLSLDKEQQAKFHSHWWEEHIGIRKRTKFKSDTSKTSEALLHNVATLQSYIFVSFQHVNHFQSLQLH